MIPAKCSGHFAERLCGGFGFKKVEGDRFDSSFSSPVVSIISWVQWGKNGQKLFSWRRRVPFQDKRSKSCGKKAYGCGSENRNSKMGCPGWKHGPKPAVCPFLILSHSHISPGQCWRKLLGLRRCALQGDIERDLRFLGRLQKRSLRFAPDGFFLARDAGVAKCVIRVQLQQ